MTATAQTATVNGSTVYQTMDGFGGQDWAFGDNLTSGQADMFFSTTVGIGLDVVRSQNTWDGGIPDLATLQQAVARSVKVDLQFASPPCGGNGTPNLKWSSAQNGESCTWVSDSNNQPPAFADGTASSNGTCFRSDQPLSTSYAAYASYIVSVIKTYQSKGIPISYLDIQQEANLPSSSLGACAWANGSQFDQFIASYLGPQLSAAGLSPKLILGPAYNWFDTDYVSTCLSDPACAQYVSIAAGHAYGYPYTPYPYLPGTSGGRHLWVTETGDQGTPYDASMGEAITWAQNIHAFLTVANVSYISWWQLAYDSSAGFVPDGGLTDQNFNPAKRFYAEGNWSKFVRPGWVRIGATGNPQNGVLVTAFMNQSSGAIAIVAVNSNSGSVPQSFSLNGISAGSLTPYVTDANNNLSSQPAVSLSNNGFTATLSASSVTTFVGSGIVPPAPTNLTVTLAH